MIRLFSRGEVGTRADASVVGRITTVGLELSRRSDHVFLLREPGETPELDGYAGVLALPTAERPRVDVPATRITDQLGYLADGDVVRLAPMGGVSVLYRKSSRHNT